MMCDICQKCVYPVKEGDERTKWKEEVKGGRWKSMKEMKVTEKKEQMETKEINENMTDERRGN